MKLDVAKTILEYLEGELYENYMPRTSDEPTTGVIVNSFEEFFGVALEALLDMTVASCTDSTWDSIPNDVFLKIIEFKNALRDVKADNLGNKVVVY